MHTKRPTKNAQPSARALRRYNADLKDFADLMAGYRPPHDQIRALLDFACRRLEASGAALGELQGANYRLLTSCGAAAAGLGPVLAPGVVLALGAAELAAIHALEQADTAAPDAPEPPACALPPHSAFTAAALLRWTDAEDLPHLGALSFAPGQAVCTTNIEKLELIQLVGQGIASSLRERAVLDGLLAARSREIVGHLASGVAHDFNNLLGVIDINLDYLTDLLRTRALPAEVGEVLEETRLAARHAQMVTAGLLSLSRGRRLATAPTPVSAVVERFTRTLARILPAEVLLRTQVTPGLVALADEALLQTALLNLCINARDAMGGRGTLGIEVARIARARTNTLTLTLGRLEPGDYVEIAVADTGVGMSAEVLGHIFEPLFSTKSSGRGTGLGLFMVREFADRCGGAVGVETRPGRGSRFTVYLPVASALPPPPSDRIPTAVPLPPLAARVLLVDDDPGIRAVLHRTLQAHGLRVDQAANGAEALAWLEGGAPCDLVLSDIVMPQMDGIELHRRLARAIPGLPVLLMTADEHQSVQAAGLPVDTAILFKPLVTEMLLSRIQERLARRDEG
ncbi:ATP-binding protein [uncultured Thiodictyon sp.]|uniref:ATP-binding protein n=1 Tax=uncultured Thiodictyon sp. TaxID=1846217 RepID=UPI0025E43495|nr:ATP-binding protein [uncultured Thiodictyon sp.]